MRARRFVWSDPTVQKLAANFVPALDDEGVLRGAESEEGKLYRRIVDELGHFKGELTDANNNRQGIYCIAPSGEFLDSVYSVEDPKEVSDMLERALKKWNALPKNKRFATKPIDPAGAGKRNESQYPEDGLVLLQNMRDLPRPKPEAGDWLAGSWNKDYAWFRKEEMKQFLPDRLEKGRTKKVPQKLMKRLAAHHFVDYVQCIGYPFQYNKIKHASITTKVEKVEGDLVTLRLEGKSKTSQEGEKDPEKRNNDNQWRGVEVSILGRATYNKATEKFTTFDMVAIGKRWGGLRWKDEGGPIGFEFRLAPNRAMDRTPPYGLPWGDLLGDPYW